MGVGSDRRFGADEACGRRSLIDILIIVALVSVSLVAVILSLVRLPGTWLVVAAAAGCSWYYDWARPGWKILAILIALAAAAEVIELLAGSLSARKAGASRRASWCALAGSVVGMFVFTIPLPIIGTVIGGVIGCFAGAMIGELTIRDDISHSARVGLFAAAGHIVGGLLKTIVCLIMAGLAVFATVVTR